jgi:hypothetical protein
MRLTMVTRDMIEADLRICFFSVNGRAPRPKPNKNNDLTGKSRLT